LPCSFEYFHFCPNFVFTYGITPRPDTSTQGKN
jgi:hypothetical protein